MHQFTTVDGPVPVISMVDERLSTTTICLASKYGSRLDLEGQCGLAHVLEHVLMSAPVGAVPSLSEYVERLGGHANAETGLDRMLFYAQTDPDDAEEIAGLLHQAVLQPRWSEDVLEQEKRSVFQELAMAAADHSDVAQDAFLARFFPGHPMGRPVAGTKADVERCDGADEARAPDWSACRALYHAPRWGSRARLPAWCAGVVQGELAEMIDARRRVGRA